MTAKAPSAVALMDAIEQETGLRYSVAPQYVIVPLKRGDTFRDAYVKGLRHVRPDVTAFRGPCVVVGRREFDDGRPSVECYRSTKLVSPTWADLMRVAKRQQRMTRDRHHVFLENITAIGPGTWGPKREPVTLIRLGLGS